jgi:hypothetical protein
MRRRWITRLVLLATVACALPAGTASAARHDWPRFGFDAARTNNAKVAAGIAAGDLGGLKRQDVALPGTVDSSPLYLHHVKVKGRSRDVFLVATTYGRVLALGADTGKVLWTYTSPSYDELAGGGQYTTASPVVDRARGFVYAATPDGFVRKLSLGDGAEVLDGAWPASITLGAEHEKISSPLNLSRGRVIATLAGFGGPGNIPFQGHVAIVDADSGRLQNVFNALCSNLHRLIDNSDCPEYAAGIWARSGAVVVPDSGHLLVATGNGAFNGKTHWGDSVLELSRGGGKLLGNWTPKNQDALESFDIDLGSTAPALLRWKKKRRLALQSGKDGDIRLLDVGDLNGRGKPCECKGGELQMIHTPGDVGVYSTPGTWRHDGKSWAFVTTYEDTTAWRVSGKQPRLHKVWRHRRAGSSPVIAGGLLYVYDPVKGGVAVYRPATGKRLGVLPSAPGHWNSPVVTDGRVAIPVGSAKTAPTTGTLTIYRRP